MGKEGVRILLALESRRKPPPSEEEAKVWLKIFCKREIEGDSNG